MESFNQNQDVSDTTESIPVNIRLDKELNDRLERFADVTVRSKSHAARFLLMKGFEKVEQEGNQV